MVIGLTGTDRAQQQRLLHWVGEGHLRGAFAHSNQTSGPGPVVMVPVYLAARAFTSVSLSYVAASVACLVPLAIATVAATRAYGVAARSPRELLGLALVVGGVPVMANYLEVFHPADVLATAAVLGAYAAVLRRRIPLAAVLLGFGLATKQWVVVAVAVLAILETGRERMVLVAGSVATCIVLVAPFFAADPQLTLAVLAAKDTISSSRVLPGLLPLGETGAFLVSRYLPLAIVLVLCCWLRDRGARATPVVAIAALGVALGVRAAFDTAGYGYYAAPGYAALVVALVGAAQPRHLPAVAASLVAGGGILWARLAAFEWPTIVMRALRGKRLPTQIIEHRSVPWATVASILLFAIPAVCLVLLERASRPTSSEAGGSGDPATGRR
ncbi:MAG: hypothetical protein JWO77_1936 [Ilumatobacteraceae bacterium]|nr:hypothetical protein [Ilumatobacteraceae bacterium]